MALIDIKNSTIRIRGGTAGQSIEVKIGAGNLTYSEKKAIEYIKDRGVIDTVREGDQEPIDVKLDFQWIHITAASGETAPTLEDAIKQRGPASTWDSSSDDPCEPYAVDIVIQDVPICSTEDPETIILPDFRWESLDHDLRAATIAVSGKCNARQALVSRGAVSSY